MVRTDRWAVRSRWCARRSRPTKFYPDTAGRGGGVGRTLGVMFGLGVIDGRGVAVGVAVGVDGW